MTTAYRTCPFCEAMCGLEIPIGDDGRVGVVEYTEIDDQHRFQKDADGELVRTVPDAVEPFRFRYFTYWTGRR